MFWAPGLQLKIILKCNLIEGNWNAVKHLINAKKVKNGKGTNIEHK